MKQNLDIFGFSLTADEMKAIDALGAGDGQRTCPAPSDVV